MLLILAGITISYITNGGLIDKTQVAMNEYENADKKQQDIIDDIDDYNKQEIDLDPVYSEEGAEDNIAPTDLFEYEIINDGSIASAYMQNLPTKTAKITGINPNYIEKQNVGYHEWYYKIKYDGITDVLVIPYQAELDENGNVTENGEMYKITEVDLSVLGSSRGNSTPNYYGKSFPSVKKVIYPNTVEKIGRKENIRGYEAGDVQQPLEIIFSKNMTSIGDEAFSYCYELNEIIIPETIEYIGSEVFSGWDSNQTIYFECSEDESKNWDTDWKGWSCKANIVWNYKRTFKQQDEIIKEINKNNKWIIEGVLRENLFYLLDLSDKIILLDVNRRKRNIRILIRYIKQKLKLEQVNYTPSLKMLKSMYKWSEKYDKK